MLNRISKRNIGYNFTQHEGLLWQEMISIWDISTSNSKRSLIWKSLIELKINKTLLQFHRYWFSGSGSDVPIDKSHWLILFDISGGFTKSGHPLLIFPDNYRFHEVLESDLHLLLKYYISVVPRAEQVSFLHISDIAEEPEITDARVCNSDR